jgi:hypothetical protein
MTRATAASLRSIGGIAGIVTGVLFSIVISLVTGWPAPISATAIAGGFLFSAAVDIFFGFYPARKAARLDPIEALRHECAKARMTLTASKDDEERDLQIDALNVRSLCRDARDRRMWFYGARASEHRLDPRVQ